MKKRWLSEGPVKPPPPPHPMQPIVLDERGVARFRANKIIKDLNLNMNDVTTSNYSDEDVMQLLQLIGYSVGGYAELSYTSDESVEAAYKASKRLQRK